MSVVPIAKDETMLVADVVFRKDLYPRIEKSAATVQKYASDLEVLPPIEVNQHKELIDGWHRWTAHKEAKAERIRFIVTQTASDMELLELAIDRNSKYGLQLSEADKKDVAIRIYLSTPVSERRGKREVLQKILSVSAASLSRMLSRTDKEERDKRDRRIFDLWMSCHTQEQIADTVGVDQPRIQAILSLFSDWKKMIKSDVAQAEHAVDFTVPIYNIWKRQTKTEGVEHFGNTEIQWLDNLLYLYTQPFDVVVDPFAGGGSTIDICKKRFRRYWVSDRKPKEARTEEIRQHDLTTGLPKLPHWHDVALVYLDPPYWKQAEGQYSNDAEDLANMSLKEFTDTLVRTIKAFAKKLKPGAVIALIIQPTQWKAPDRAYTDHISDLLRAIDLPVEMRYSVPYESQQCTAQMVEWAQENRKCLVLTREIVVWRV